MKNLKLVFTIILLGFISITLINAQKEAKKMVEEKSTVDATMDATDDTSVDIISIDEVKKKIKSKEDFILIDASKKKKYAKAHLKGAMRVNYKKFHADGEIKGVVKSPEEIAAQFGELGISENSEIIIYDGGSQKYSSRLYWLLKYVGAKNVKLLHKDDAKWRKARVMLTAEVPEPREKVVFNLSVDQSANVFVDYVKEKLEDPNVLLIDTRDVEEFSGEKEVTENKKGRIPGSINLPYKDLLTETGAFKSKEELAVVAKEYGITPDKEVIFFCKTSVRGAVAYFAFKEILKFPNIELFDGACLAWCAKYELEQ